MLIGDIPVPFDLPRKPPPTLDGGPGGRGGTMAFDVALADLPAFLDALANTTETVDLGNGSSVERVVPLQHPLDLALFAVGYRVEFFGSPGGSSEANLYGDQFSLARVLVDFATLPFGVGGDTPYYTLTSEFGVTVETIPDAGLTFTDGSHSTGDYGLTVPVFAYNLTTFMSTGPIPYSIASLVGHINSTSFLITGVGTFPVGTIQFTGGREEFSRGMYSQTRVKNFGLKFRPRPWNQVLRKDGVWDTPTLGTSGLPKYTSSDLNILKYA